MIDSKITLGWDYSAEWLDVEPTIDDSNPPRMLCIKEQLMVNGKENGKPNYWAVPVELQYDAQAVNNLMQTMADNTKRTVQHKTEAISRSLSDR